MTQSYKKLKHYSPAHEVEEFTELFWNRVQQWRRIEGSGS